MGASQMGSTSSGMYGLSRVCASTCSVQASFVTMATGSSKLCIEAQYMMKTGILFSMRGEQATCIQRYSGVFPNHTLILKQSLDLLMRSVCSPKHQRKIVGYGIKDYAIRILRT